MIILFNLEFSNAFPRSSLLNGGQNKLTLNVSVLQLNAQNILQNCFSEHTNSEATKVTILVWLDNSLISELKCALYFDTLDI